MKIIPVIQGKTDPRLGISLRAAREKNRLSLAEGATVLELSLLRLALLEHGECDMEAQSMWVDAARQLMLPPACRCPPEAEAHGPPCPRQYPGWLRDARSGRTARASAAGFSPAAG